MTLALKVHPHAECPCSCGQHALKNVVVRLLLTFASHKTLPGLAEGLKQGGCPPWGFLGGGPIACNQHAAFSSILLHLDLWVHSPCNIFYNSGQPSLRVCLVCMNFSMSASGKHKILAVHLACTPVIRTRHTFLARVCMLCVAKFNSMIEGPAAPEHRSSAYQDCQYRCCIPSSV